MGKDIKYVSCALMIFLVLSTFSAATVLFDPCIVTGSGTLPGVDGDPYTTNLKDMGLITNYEPISGDEDSRITSSEFALVYDKSWINATGGGNPFFDMYGTVCNSAGYGDLTGDGSMEIITGSSDFDSDLFDPKDQRALRVWMYDENTEELELMAESIPENLDTISAIATGPTGSQYIVTGGRDKSDPPQSDLRLWSYDGDSISLLDTQQWLDDGYNNTLETVAVRDINSDGNLEIVAGGQSKIDDDNSKAQLTIWTIEPDSSLSLRVKTDWDPDGPSSVMTVKITDLQSDGVYEIITGGYTGQDSGGSNSMSEVRIWQWDGDDISLLDTVSWFDTGSSGVFDMDTDDMTGDGELEIVTSGANEQMDGTAVEIAVLNYPPLEILTRERFFADTGLEGGGSLGLSVDVVDGDLDGELNIFVSGLAEGPHPGGTTFWGFTMACRYSDGVLVRDAEHTWLEDDETAVFDHIVVDFIGDPHPEIVHVGYQAVMDGDEKRSYGRIWIWNYVGDAPITTMEINLNEGWNFVSFNLNILDTDLESILEHAEYGIAGNYDRLMYYDASTDEWLTYVPGREDRYNNLENWDHHMGVWIRMNTDDTLTVEGYVPGETTITLQPGWNMVGLPSSSSGNHNLPAEVSRIGYFDGSEEYNLAYDHDPGNFVFQPGEGYWVYNDADYTVDWIVEY